MSEGGQGGQGRARAGGFLPAYIYIYSWNDKHKHRVGFCAEVSSLLISRRERLMNRTRLCEAAVKGEREESRAAIDLLTRGNCFIRNVCERVRSCVCVCVCSRSVVWLRRRFMLCWDSAIILCRVDIVEEVAFGYNDV